MSEAAKPLGISKITPESKTPKTAGQSPDLSRLLSISSIIVALVVAGALALEGVIVRQELVSAPQPVETAKVQTEPALEKIRADKKRMRHLEKRLALLERQIVVLQTQVVSERKQAAALEAKVASLQLTLAEAETPPTELPAVAVHPMPAPAEQKVEPAQTDTTRVVAAATTGPEPADPEANTSQTLPVTSDTIETGSIDPGHTVPAVETPQSDLAAMVKPAVRDTKPLEISRTRFALALDLHDTMDDLKATWALLQATHADAIEPYGARALPQGTQEGTLVYRLMVGPIENVAEAARRCARLVRSGVKCKAAIFSGEPLDTPPSPGTLIQVEVVADDDGPPLQPLPDPKIQALPTRLRNLVANAPLPRPKPKPSS